MNKELREKCKIIVAYNTIDNIEVIAIEELAELIQAIVKKRRWNQDDESLRQNSIEIENNLYEEMADVYILLEQLKYLNCMSDDVINRVIKQKLNRTYEVLGIKEEKD